MSLPPPPRPRQRGFTLAELLVVVAVMGLLAAVSVPAMRALKGAGDFTRACSDLEDAVNLARTYAVANNTYVYLGIGEFDADQPPTARPQRTGYGRLAVATVASRDGLSHFNPAAGGGAWDYAGVLANLAPVRKLQVFDRVHLAAGLPSAASGGMARPQNGGGGKMVYSLGASGDQAPFSFTPFSLPLGTQNGSGQYLFGTVIAFNPQGSPTAGGTLVPWIEIDLQPHNGPGQTADSPPVSSQGQQAALLVDGTTGAARLYRP